MARDKTEPKTERSAAADEHQGLAGKLIELRAVVEDQRKATVRDMADLKSEVARISDRQAKLQEKLDQTMTEIDRRQRELDQQLRTGAEQVRATGEMARKMTDHMKVLDELREVAADPHEVIKPVQRQVALLDGDLKTLRTHVDKKFEALPKPQAEPWESRGADELERARAHRRSSS